MNLILWRVQHGTVGLTGWGWLFLGWTVLMLAPVSGKR